MVRISSLTFAPLALAVAGASAKTSLYLSPARNIAAPIRISAEEADRILSHHINTGDALDQKDETEMWAHVLHSNKEVGQRVMVERLFDGHEQEQNRLLVLMHGSAYHDVIPSHLSPTHTIPTSPNSNSFDALFDSYLSSISQILKSSDSAFSHLAGTFMDGFSASIDWLSTTSHSAASKWSQEASELKSTAFSKLEKELRSAEALLAKLESSGKNEDLSLQPLRFAGLEEVESTYGADSVEYAKAKKWVQEAVEKITSLFEAKSESQGRAASIAFIVTSSSNGSGAVPHLTKRSDLLLPFKRQLSFDSALSSQDALESKPSPSPSPFPSRLPSNLLSTCFTSATDLEKATNSCSGHGSAVKTSKGGKPCYRCQCKATEVRKGKKVYWAGAACEKKDISTEFVLLASSVLLLVLASVGSVYFLWKQASEELPGTLASVSISLK
ncbi:uncharacterized protein UBRO_03198 [Ustilago bromivora]|nr:uncharacterized protein UBRO_03198 [Ustilago bromivora]